MKTKALYSIILASAALTPLAAADELNQTISVTKETEVVEHKAEKMEALPDAAPSTASPVKLKFSDWAVPAAVWYTMLTNSRLYVKEVYRLHLYIRFLLKNVSSAGKNLSWKWCVTPKTT